MSQLTIQAETHSYDVLIEAGIRHRLGTYASGYKEVLVVTDDQVAEKYLDDVVAGLMGQKVYTHIVPSGEASKSMKRYEDILDKCIDVKLDRNSLLIALGGGMIGDLAGFAASTYLRGIDFIQMPTTILAHDSSVGGKVAINHPSGKNLIGSFYNPVQVLYDVETLHSLPEKEVRSGYGEVIKHAMLSDYDWLTDLLGLTLSNIGDQRLIRDLEKGIQVKAGIVEKDEKEQGLRKHLNLGHTLAHAIEAEVGYGEVTHGEAVAIGLWFAMRLSERKGDVRLPIKDYVNWLKMNGYPLSSIRSLQSVALLKRMKVDKKTLEQKVHMVLLQEIADPYVVSVEDEEMLTQLELFLKEVIET
ncbi:3-dehydroquinate synthase [Halobacillus litoralis]|uniref:3-dehydroquinate synthase n=1 Tax=Halobacillus litoralis TaxID=45668 RepID=UPI001CD4C54C|nr:3-dehydroquinate synthase [Halobacillus litoralis]MCA0970350.1 3-dehydroquinate synthase [Halobacillus litoralis]